MTDDEVADYVRYLRAHLPAAHNHLSTEQVRAVLDAEERFLEEEGALVETNAVHHGMQVGREPPDALCQHGQAGKQRGVIHGRVATASLPCRAS